MTMDSRSVLSAVDSTKKIPSMLLQSTLAAQLLTDAVICRLCHQSPFQLPQCASLLKKRPYSLLAMRTSGPTMMEHHATQASDKGSLATRSRERCFCSSQSMKTELPVDGLTRELALSELPLGTACHGVGSLISVLLFMTVKAI